MADAVIINVEVAVVREDGRYLMIVRGAGEGHAAGALAFPGGTLDFELQYDALEATAIREVLEEVGLAIADPRYIESHTFEVSNDRVVDIVFLADYQGGEPTITDLDEVAEFRWMSAEEIRADPAAPEWVFPTLERIERHRTAR